MARTERSGPGDRLLLLSGMKPEPEAYVIEIEWWNHRTGRGVVETVEAVLDGEIEPGSIYI